MTVIGWDIGGVNIKAARVNGDAPLAARNDPFEIQRAPATLAARLEGIATATRRREVRRRTQSR